MGEVFNWWGVEVQRPKPTEFYANVMVCEGLNGRLYSGFGLAYDTAQDADVAIGGNRNTNRFRIHVKPKPEGAPRRYASELDQWLWEAGARSLARLTAPRTPKIEESAS